MSADPGWTPKGQMTSAGYPGLLDAARAAVEAYDDALAVCCPRCEKEPEGAIWINTPANPNGVALSTAVEALRAALWGGETSG